MQRIAGYTLFWMGIGMLLAVLIPCRFFVFLLCGGLLMTGYRIFCMGRR